MARVEAPCPLCPGAASAPHLQFCDPDLAQEPFTIVRCASCGLLRTSPRPSDAELMDFYPKSYSNYDETVPAGFLTEDLKGRFKKRLLNDIYGYPTAEPSIASLLLRPLFKLAAHKFAFFPRWVEAGSLLEVGCATGRYLSLMREVGWKTKGVEPHEKSARFAQKTLDLDVHAGVLASAKLAAASFDAVIMFHVLEHVPAPLAVLEELKRILKPGGSLYVAVPNAGSLEARLLGKYFWAWEAPRHLHHFTPSTLTKLLERSGFTVKETRHDLFNNAADAALSLRLWARSFGMENVGTILGSPLVRALYAPIGVPLAALGIGTRFLVRAES